MASHELLSADDGGKESNPPPEVHDRVPIRAHVRKSGGSTGGALPGESVGAAGYSCSRGRYLSAPRTASRKGGGVELKPSHSREEKDAGKSRSCEELETFFTSGDENVTLRLSSPETSCRSPSRPVRNGEPCSETFPDFSFMSEDDLSITESSGSSIDYGFISAVTFLVTGISLVIISYAVPRDVVVDRDSVSAREMERLEMESARIGAHLDRCVIAGLCLLTLGGVVLSMLLMVSMWKGEMYRRKVIAYSKRSAKQYGSISLKTRTSPSHSSVHLSLEEEVEETLA